MNVKAGDLAIVTKSECGNQGKIVEVINFAGEIPGYIGNDRWIVESLGGALIDTEGEIVNHLNDSHLRPISGIPDIETERKITIWR